MGVISGVLCERMPAHEIDLVVMAGGGMQPAYCEMHQPRKKRHVLRVVSPPQPNYSQHQHTHNVAGTRLISASMVRVADEALPMAQKMACWYVVALISLHSASLPSAC